MEKAMEEVWTILMAAGVPDGAVRPAATSSKAPPTVESVRGALAALAPKLDDLSLRDRELLFAWLRAYSHHWPTTFAATFGAIGNNVLSVLGEERFDPNRYLKFRRIAIANLAATI